MYATVADMRAEGVTEYEATDARLASLLEEASRLIDLATGWFFEPKELTYAFDGRGLPTLEPSAPPIRIDELKINGQVKRADLFVVGAPVMPGFYAPCLSLRQGAFPKGRGNVEITGLWGFTEPDGTPEGCTPLPIRRACMMLALGWLPPLGDVEASSDARNRWRVIEEKTKDQSYKLAGLKSAEPRDIDPEVEVILWRYRRPMGLGAI